MLLLFIHREWLWDLVLLSSYCQQLPLFALRLSFNYPACHFRFGGRQIHASEDDGSINHALVRDLEYDAKRLEEFGAELEGD